MIRVAVIDIEPIEPAWGGSRLRLQGLYSGLGAGFTVGYVGAYHWRGPPLRRYRHSPAFEEVTVPFSDRHLAAAAVMQSNAGAYSIIDASFPLLGAFSEAYCAHARAAIGAADIVVFSHPWAYPVVGAAVQQRQLLVYDAHNVESEIKRRLLGDSPAARTICNAVDRAEGALCRAADLVLACSHEDRMALAQIYALPFGKVRVWPNGVAVGAVTPADPAARADARRALGLGSAPLAIFIGGHYPPNIRAGEFIRDRLAPACPATTFAILGDAGAALTQDGDSPLPSTLRVTGRIDDGAKRLWLHAADIGINPMFEGSGTNVKMFDYMAAALPVVSTPFGARGIAAGDLVLAADAEAFAGAIHRLGSDANERAQRGAANRAAVERDFDWARLSRELGALLARHRRKEKPAPFFSVTIPTLGRPERLRRLLDLLAVQSDPDFEVIVVDQNETPFAWHEPGLDITIIHSDIRSQVRARNLAAALCRGQVIAMIDDDCEPCDTWLAEARRHLERPGVVGLEGRCFSNRRHDPAWRSVDNYGAEGQGFMTCNLFVRTEAFNRIDGFDPAFYEFQHRYDTDFGWRLQALGDVPFSEDAFVYHPPWPRTTARESAAERDRLFEADALLLRKHPERYRDLFLREENFTRGAAFWAPFLRGMNRLGLALPDYIRAAHARSVAGTGPPP